MLKVTAVASLGSQRFGNQTVDELHLLVVELPTRSEHIAQAGPRLPLRQPLHPGRHHLAGRGEAQALHEQSLQQLPVARHGGPPPSAWWPWESSSSSFSARKRHASSAWSARTSTPPSAPASWASRAQAASCASSDAGLLHSAQAPREFAPAVPASRRPWVNCCAYRSA